MTSLIKKIRDKLLDLVIWKTGSKIETCIRDKTRQQIRYKVWIRSRHLVSVRITDRIEKEL